ncbi:MAG: GWxTD domain-containing protein [Terracidiphilus sp.]
MKSLLSRSLYLFLILTFLAVFAHAADRSKDLPPHYRHWLNEEVNYIIDSNERKQFLSLTTDVQRDSFIAAFWKVRNPDPNSETNTYKDEHYRRLAYANEHFGSVVVQDGWRSDRGRIYIVLGPPKQIEPYPAARNVRPMEIWFYQSPSRALPPYFNLIFFKKSIGEPYTLYSPNSDGPAHLVSTLEALNDQKRSLDTLRKSLGDEVATTAVDLIPGEQVNLDQYEPSMSSDLLLSMIEGLPDNPLTQEELNLNRMREHVTISLLIGGQDATISYCVYRDAQGRQTLNYLMRTILPDPGIVGKRAEGGYYYDLTLRTTVTTADNKPVYEQEDAITGDLTPEQSEIAKKKDFAAEARVPLAQGKYTIIATLTNNVDHVATKQHASVIVPAISGESVAFSSPLAYTAPVAVKDPRGVLPFSISGLRFTPRGAQNAYLPEGARLPLVFQLWLDPRTAASPSAEKIHLHYAFGSIAASHDAVKQEDEEIDAANRDQAGNLLTGHTLDTSALSPGSYQVVVSANRVGEQKTTYVTLSLHVEPAADFIDTWTAYGTADPGGETVDDLKRGLSAEAQGADVEAQAAFERALMEGQGDMRPLDDLAVLLARKGLTDQLAQLSQQPILAKTAANPSTLLSIAWALNKNGNSKAVVRLLEAQILLQPPSVDLYNALADACQASGNTKRANELRTMVADLKR